MSRFSNPLRCRVAGRAASARMAADKLVRLNLRAPGGSSDTGRRRGPSGASVGDQEDEVVQRRRVPAVYRAAVSSDPSGRAS